MSSQQLYDLDALRSFLRDQAGVTGPIEVTGRAPAEARTSPSSSPWTASAGSCAGPPSGELLPTSHDMLREYRFLRAIHGTPVPVPEPIVACPDPAVIGAPFYTMRYVDGLLLSGQANNPGLADPDECRALTTELISVLADLHGLDWAGLGLEGRPTGFLQRQVRRWTGQLALTPTAPRLGPGLTEVTDWISANVPDSRRESIVHGDYTPNNILVSRPPGDPRGRSTGLGDGDHRGSSRRRGLADAGLGQRRAAAPEKIRRPGSPVCPGASPARKRSSCTSRSRAHRSKTRSTGPSPCGRASPSWKVCTPCTWKGVLRNRASPASNNLSLSRCRSSSPAQSALMKGNRRAGNIGE